MENLRYMKNTSVVGKEKKDQVQDIKRLIFLIITPIVILCLPILWVITRYSGEISRLDLYAVPTLTLLLLVLFIAYWAKAIPIRFFERSIYALVFVYFAIKTYTVFDSAIFLGSSIDSNFLMWIPFLYLLGFILLDIRNALLSSMIFLMLTLLYGIFIPVHSNLIGASRHNSILLIELYLSGLFYIIILYFVSRQREHYISYQVLAEIMSTLAMTDSLTQVDNRRRLEKYIQEEVNRAARHKLPLTVMMFDIDNFKKINDRFGHASGDLVLVKIARLIRDSLRSSDHFGRWGGDEFLCIATNTNEATAVQLAERLRGIIEQAQILDHSQVTCSFGVTRYHRNDTLDTLMRRADLGLFQAKKNGCNQVVTIAPETTLPI